MTLWVLLLALDGGLTLTDAGLSMLSAEDQEIVDNLELLQHLDDAADLELMQELGR